MSKFTPKTETQMEIDELERGRLRNKVLNFLKANDIEYELYEHPALYTVEECLTYWGGYSRGYALQEPFLSEP